MRLTEWRTCRQPARMPIGGEFLMGKLATCKEIFRLFILLHDIKIFSSHWNILFASSSIRFFDFFVTVGLTGGQPVQTGTLWMVSLGQTMTPGCVTLRKLDAVSHKGCQINMRTATKRMFGVHLMAKDLACASARVTTWLEYIEEIATSCIVLRSLCVAKW